MDDSEQIEWLKRLAIKAGFSPRRVQAHRKFILDGQRTEIDCAIVSSHDELLIALESVGTHSCSEKKKTTLKRYGIEIFEFSRNKKGLYQLQAQNFIEWVKKQRELSRKFGKRPHWRNFIHS